MTKISFSLGKKKMPQLLKTTNLIHSIHKLRKKLNLAISIREEKLLDEIQYSQPAELE